MITNPTADKAINSQRIFLRLPVKLPAIVILDGKPCIKVLISDLSSTGLSFVIAENKNLPLMFDLRFRLRFFSRPISIGMEVKNKASVRGGVRIGCIFVQVSEKARNSINNHIYQLLNFIIADNFIFPAAFLCCIDVMWKLAARFANEYYIKTEFGRNAGMHISSPFSEAAFVCYAVASFAAVFIVIYRFPVKGKQRFIAGIMLLTALFIYLSWKNISCAQYKMWDSGCFIAETAFWWEIFLNFCVAASIAACIAFLRKTSLMFKILRAHTEGELRRSES